MPQRAAIRMTPEEESDYIEGEAKLVLVSNGPDGLPHPMPMFFTRTPSGSILISTYATSQKTRNIERDPHVGLERGAREAAVGGGARLEERRLLRQRVRGSAEGVSVVPRVAGGARVAAAGERAAAVEATTRGACRSRHQRGAWRCPSAGAT